MHCQIGRVTDNERASRHLLCNTVGKMSMMGSMYQRVSLEMRTAAATLLGYILLYLPSLLLLCVCSHYAMHNDVIHCSASPLCGRWTCAPIASECARYIVHVCYCRRSYFVQSYKSTISCKVEWYVVLAVWSDWLATSIMLSVLWYL